MRRASRAAGLALAAGCTALPEPLPADVAVELSPPEEGKEALTITTRELRSVLARRRVQVTGNLDAPPLPDAVQRAVLDELIETKLFEAEARKVGLTVSSTVVQAELDAAFSSVPDAQLARALNESYQTEESLRASIRRRLLLDALFRRSVNRTVRPEEIEAQWAEWPAERKMHPPRVRAAQIITSSEQTAKTVLKALRGGAEFEDLASTYSVAPNAAAGGYLGWFARNEMPEIVETTCFALEPGTVSEIVPSEYGYHLFKVYERRDGQPVQLEEARAELVRSIRERRIRRAQGDLLARLRKEWTVVENDAAIREVFKWGR